MLIAPPFLAAVERSTPLPILTQPDPIQKVTVGSPVYTSEGQRIGTVRERRGHLFKVGTPLFHHNFWLPAVAIAEVEPNSPVMLWMDRERVDEHKIKTPP